MPLAFAPPVPQRGQVRSSPTLISTAATDASPTGRPARSSPGSNFCASLNLSTCDDHDKNSFRSKPLPSFGAVRSQYTTHGIPLLFGFEVIAGRHKGFDRSMSNLQHSFPCRPNCRNEQSCEFVGVGNMGVFDVKEHGFVGEETFNRRGDHCEIVTTRTNSPGPSNLPGSQPVPLRCASKRN